MDTIRVTIDCGGMAPPGNDDADTRRIAATVLGAFVDPDPGDVKVEVVYVNDTIAVELIERKHHGGDCTEDESAWIKRFLRANPETHPLVLPLIAAYPAEASEVTVGSDPGRGDPEPEAVLVGPWVTARVHDEGDHWTIDLVNERGDYSEFVWDHYVDERSDMTSDRPGNFDTMQQALVRVPEFIAEHGAEETWNTILIVGVLPEDIRIELTQAGGDYRVFAPPYLPEHYDGDSQLIALAPFGEVFIPTLDKAINFVARTFHATECPFCGGNEQLQLLAEATHSWTVAVEGGVLVNRTGWEDTDAPTTNERMFCGKCGNEFPKPEDWKIEYR